MNGILFICVLYPLYVSISTLFKWFPMDPQCKGHIHAHAEIHHVISILREYQHLIHVLISLSYSSILYIIGYFLMKSGTRCSYMFPIISNLQVYANILCVYMQAHVDILYVNISMSHVSPHRYPPLCRLFPRDQWNKVHLQMIYFGREYCTAKLHDVSISLCERISLRLCHGC